MLIAIVALVAGYALGQFSAPAGQTVTTTSSTTITEVKTITTTSIRKITSTTTVVGDLPSTIPPPANSTAIIRGHLLLNGSIFLMLSIDKPTYVLGDTVHIKGTLTNLTPKNISLSIWDATTKIFNNGNFLWVSPEWSLQGGIGPPPIEDVDLRPGEILSLDWATRDWNMTGIHRTSPSSAERSLVIYNGILVPEGQYDVFWNHQFSFRVNSTYVQEEMIDDTIPFTITK